MSENQPEQPQQVDAEDVRSADVQQGQDPEPQVEQQPAAPLEGDEEPAPREEQADENARTDASGRTLHPWETAPKANEEQDASQDQ